MHTYSVLIVLLYRCACIAQVSDNLWREIPVVVRKTDGTGIPAAFISGSVSSCLTHLDGTGTLPVPVARMHDSISVVAPGYQARVFTGATLAALNGTPVTLYEVSGTSVLLEEWPEEVLAFIRFVADTCLFSQPWRTEAVFFTDQSLDSVGQDSLCRVFVNDWMQTDLFLAKKSLLSPENWPSYRLELMIEPPDLGNHTTKGVIFSAPDQHGSCLMSTGFDNVLQEVRFRSATGWVSQTVYYHRVAGVWYPAAVRQQRMANGREVNGSLVFLREAGNKRAKVLIFENGEVNIL